MSDKFNHFEIVINSKEDYERVKIQCNKLGILISDFDNLCNFYRCSNDLFNRYHVHSLSCGNSSYVDNTCYPSITKSYTVAEFLQEIPDYDLW